MGYIKKLKSNELVGGTDKTTIYPVTSTEAVFEEVSDGEFKSQKYLNNHITNERIVDNTIENRKLKDDTIDMGKLNTQLKTTIQNAYDASWKVKEEPFSLETKYDANDVVYDPATNSSYVSLTADNQGNPVNPEDEGYVEGKWRIVINGISAVESTEVINETVTELQNQVSDKIEDAQDQLDAKIADAQEQLDAATSDARGAAAAAEAVTANKVADAQVGYFECNTSAGTALKQTTLDYIGTGDDKSYYVIPAAGSNVKIKMQYANTATGTVELQFGTNTATKKPLIYNGEPASASNSWDAGETISVYYDGTNYQATNVQGGGKGVKNAVDYVTRDVPVIALNTIYSVNARVKDAKGAMLRVIKPVTALKNTENLSVGDLKIADTSGTTYKAVAAIADYTGDDTDYSENDYARGTFASNELTVAVSTAADGTITIQAGDEENSVTITSESTAEGLATALAALSFTGWTGSADGAVVTFTRSTVGAITNPFTVTVSEDAGVTVTPVYTNGIETVRQFDGSEWTAKTAAELKADTNLFTAITALEGDGNLIELATQPNSVTQDLTELSDEMCENVQQTFIIADGTEIKAWITANGWGDVDNNRYSYRYERDPDWNMMRVTANANYNSVINFYDRLVTPVKGDTTGFIKGLTVTANTTEDIPIPDTCQYIVVGISPYKKNDIYTPSSVLMFKKTSQVEQNADDIKSLNESMAKYSLVASRGLSVSNKSNTINTVAIPFVEGKRYRVTINASSTYSSVMSFYLCKTTTFSDETKFAFATIAVGSTSTVTTYNCTDADYVYLGHWASGTHTMSFTVKIEEIGLLDVKEIDKTSKLVRDIKDLKGVALAAWRGAGTFTVDHTRCCMSYSVAENNLAGGSLEIKANSIQNASVYFLSNFITDPTNDTYTVIGNMTISAGATSVLQIPDGTQGIIINSSPNSLSAPDKRYFPTKCKAYLLPTNVEPTYMVASRSPQWINLGRIWTHVAAGDSVIGYPYIMRPRHANALGRYYMYYSYDHQYGSGANVGIKLAYSNDLFNWTLYGNVMKAKDQWPDYTSSTEQETETPWVVWDERNSRYLMYWHSTYCYEGPEYEQTTYISESTDGITWTYIKNALDVPLAHIVGDGHDGYWKTYYMKGYYWANFLLGGTTDSSGGRAISIDGLNWQLIQQHHGFTRFALSGTQNVGNSEFSLGLGGFNFEAGGRYFAVSTAGKPAAGSSPKETNIYIQEYNEDFTQAKGAATLLHEMSAIAGETANIRDLSGFVDDNGDVYIIYITASDNLTSYTDFFLARIIL